MTATLLFFVGGAWDSLRSTLWTEVATSQLITSRVASSSSGSFIEDRRPLLLGATSLHRPALHPRPVSQRPFQKEHHTLWSSV